METITLTLQKKMAPSFSVSLIDYKKQDAKNLQPGTE